MNNTGVHPIADQVLVRRDSPRVVTESGIQLPDGSEEWPTVGVVLEVGPRVRERQLTGGVRVFFRSRPASALIRDDREPEARDNKKWERVIMLREEDILGIVVEE